MRLHYFVLWCLIKVWPELFDRYFEEYQRANRLIRKNYFFPIVSVKQDSTLLQEGLWYKVDFYISKTTDKNFAVNEFRVRELDLEPDLAANAFHLENGGPVIN